MQHCSQNEDYSNIGGIQGDLAEGGRGVQVVSRLNGMCGMYESSTARCLKEGHTEGTHNSRESFASSASKSWCGMIR